MKLSTLAILIGAGLAIASTNQPSPPKGVILKLMIFTPRLSEEDMRIWNLYLMELEKTNRWYDLPTNQPSPPKLAISKGSIERDVCSTNTSYYWPDGPQGELKWTYIDAARQLMLRVNGLQTNATIPVLHVQWLMRLNKATGIWEYFAGSGETNVYAPPNGFVMTFPEVKAQAGLKNVPPPPTPK